LFSQIITVAAILNWLARLKTKQFETKNLSNMGKETVINTVTSIFKGADERNWEKIQLVFILKAIMFYCF